MRIQKSGNISNLSCDYYTQMAPTSDKQMNITSYTLRRYPIIFVLGCLCYILQLQHQIQHLYYWCGSHRIVTQATQPRLNQPWIFLQYIYRPAVCVLIVCSHTDYSIHELSEAEYIWHPNVRCGRLRYTVVIDLDTFHVA